MSSLRKTYWVKYAGICGSDINKVKDNSFMMNDILKLGHEIICLSDYGDLFVVNPFICESMCSICNQESYLLCDKVSRIGANDDGGGFSGKISINSDNLYKIPTCSHPEVGILCDGVSVILHGFHMIELHNIQNLAIIGAGSIGILAAIIAKDKYPNLSIDIYCHSIEKKDFLNSQFNNLFKYKYVNELFQTYNYYDLVLEAVGGYQTGTISHSINIVKNSGYIMVFGAFHKDCQSINNLRSLFYKQIKLIGVNSFCKKYDDFQKAVDWTFAHDKVLFPLLTDFYHIKRNPVEPEIIYQTILEHRLLKGCFVYE